jgi:hypothetical protein
MTRILKLRKNILYSRNVDGNVYACDIKDLIGWNAPDEKVYDLQAKLSAMNQSQLRTILWQMTVIDRIKEIFNNLKRVRFGFYVG